MWSAKRCVDKKRRKNQREKEKKNICKQQRLSLSIQSQPRYCPKRKWLCARGRDDTPPNSFFFLFLPTVHSSRRTKHVVRTLSRSSLFFSSLLLLVIYKIEHIKLQDALPTSAFFQIVKHMESRQMCRAFKRVCVTMKRIIFDFFFFLFLFTCWGFLLIITSGSTHLCGGTFVSIYIHTDTHTRVGRREILCCVHVLDG